MRTHIFSRVLLATFAGGLVSLTGCNTAKCDTEICYSPDTLTCQVEHDCRLAAPALRAAKPSKFIVTPALPAGLVLDPATGAITGKPISVTMGTQFTITGTPKDAPVSGHVTLTVNDLAPTGYAYAPSELVCAKDAPCSLAPPVGTGPRATTFAIAPALPTGMNFDTTTGGIAGTPTAVAASSSFTVTASNSGGSTTATVKLTVVDGAPTALRYVNNNITCVVGQACPVDAPSVSGGAVTAFTVVPALPGGLTLDAVTGAVAGTAAAESAATGYTVTGTNVSGSTSVLLAISVVQPPPTAFSYPMNPLSCARGTACSAGTPTLTGGANSTFTVTSGAIPTGMTLDSHTGAVAGTPVVAQAASHAIITARNSGGVLSADLVISVSELPPSALSYSPATLTCTEGVTCATTVPTISGGLVGAFAVAPALPAGLGIDTGTGVVRGTPTAAATSASYTITASNSGGMTSAMLTIVVNAAAPTAITYSPSSATCKKNVACMVKGPTHTGGAPTSYSVMPALPTGLTLSATDGSISGTATALMASTAFTVTGTNGLGNATTSLNLTVAQEPPSGLTYTATSLACTKGMSCALGPPTAGGGPITSYSISPSLPSGMTFDTSTGAITGTPTSPRVLTTFTVTANNSGGSATALLAISVVDQAPSGLTYTPSTVVCPRGNTCAVPAPTNSGGAVVTYSVSPSFPSGIGINSSTGAISGQANSVSSATAYTVTATNSGGTAQATVTLSVVELPPSGLTYSALGCQVGVSCSAFPSTLGGVATSFAISPTPPSWVTFDTSTGVLSGTPSATMSPVTYTVTASNVAGMATAQVSILAYNPPVDLPAVSATFAMSQFKGVGVHPTNGNIMYATSFTYMVYRTTNGGVTWRALCKARGGNPGAAYYGQVRVSPSGAAFVNDHTTVDRVIDASGGACTPLNRYIWATYEHDSWFAFGPTGRIYNWDTQDGLGYSDDDGSSFTTVVSTPSLFRSLAVDPFDATRVISVHSQWSTSPQGLMLGGSTSLDTTHTNYNEGPIFDPAHQGYIFLRMDGSWTSNGGTSWVSTGDHSVMAIDTTGAGYRLQSANPAVLQRTADIHAAAPTWTTKYSFTGENGSNSGYDDVKVSGAGATIIVNLNDHVYYSTDSGATFTRLAPSEPVGQTAMHTVAANGSTVVMGFGPAVVSSADDGNSWTATPIAPPTSGSFGSSMRLHGSLAHPQTMYLRADQFGNSSSDLVVTTDAFATSSRTTSPGGAWSYYTSVFALNQSNDTIAYSLGNDKAAKTSTTGQTWNFTTVTSPPGEWSSWYPGPGAEASPWVADQVFYTDTYAVSTGKLWLYDHAVGTNVEITSRLPFNNPAGLEVVRLSGSSYKLRVISQEGKVAESTNGTTFTAVNAAGGLATSSTWGRLIKTSPTNPNVVVTAHMQSYYAAVSFDGGASWVQFNGICSGGVRDVAISASKVFFACGSGPTRILRLP